MAVRTENSSARQISRLRGYRILACGLLFVAGATVAEARQQRNPVYVDDAPGATDAISRALDLARAGNHAEAVRVLQRLVDERGDQLLASPEDPDLFFGVREAVFAALSGNDALLGAYREIQEPAAARLLQIGREDEAERAMLPTASGFEAALRVAQQRIENAQFSSAWRTLRQLEDHPERRTEEGAAAAAELLSLAARYHIPPGGDQTVHRWRNEASLASIDIESVAPPALVYGRSPIEEASEIRLQGLVATPLRSDDLPVILKTPRIRPDRNARNGRDRAGAGQSPLLQPFVFPTLAGDMIYVNDGVEISAWERFSLTPVWRYETALADGGISLNQIGTRPIEDVGSVSLAEGIVVAATGVAVGGAREGDRRIHAMDAYTGDPLWSVTPEQVEPALTDATVRGPLMIDQSVVVAAFSKQVRERRLVGVYLAGFDLHTGRLLWTRPLGSTGSLPYGANVLLSEAGTSREGVVFRGDRLGFIAAVDVVSGRTLWNRRMPVAGVTRSVDPPWQVAAPIVHEGVVYSLAPDRQSIVALDAETGALLGRRSSAELGNPAYILGAGGHLLGVGDSVLTSLPLRAFLDKAVHPAPVAGPLDRPIAGRVTTSSERALIPVEGGVLVVALGEGGEEPEFLPLDFTGNVLVTPSQLVVVDAMSVHSYLLWDIAQRLLQDRMASDPDDPAPAATLAELAYRAGRPEMIVSAIDSAIDAIARDPLNSRNAAIRSGLFESGLEMVSAPAEQRSVTISFEEQEAILERLDRLASSSEQRVQRLMASGALYEVHGMPDRAVDAYQRILSDTALANAELEINNVVRGSGEEAARKLRGLIRRYGIDVYAVYEGEASRRLAQVRDSDNPEDLLGIARRYPMARASVEAWAIGGRLLLQRGRSRHAILALEDGLRAAEDAIPREDALIGELTGPLVTLLVDHGRVPAANALIDRIADRWPRTTVTRRGVEIGLNEIRSELMELAAALDRRPRIGLTSNEDVFDVIRGWRLIRPLLTETPGRPTDLAMLRSQGAIGVWESNPETGLAMRWSVPVQESDWPVLIDDAGLLLSRFGPTGRSLELLALEDGKTLWASASMGEVFEEWARGPGVGDGPGRLGVGTIDTPLSLRRPAREALIVADSQSVAMVDRVGRSVAFDRRTGRTLWSKQSLDKVYDIVAGDGALAVAGAARFPGEEEGVEDERANLLLFDLRTGREIGRFQPDGGRIRWARVTVDGNVVIGLDDAIASYSMTTQERLWHAMGQRAGGTVDAWVFPGRVIVLNGNDDLRQFALDDGAVSGGPLETRGRLRDHGAGLRRIHASLVGDNAAFMTGAGIVLFDNRGRLVGIDQRASQAEVTGTTVTVDYMVLVEQQVVANEGGVAVYPVSFFTNDSCALIHRRTVRLGAPPERIDAIDGRLLVSAGDATAVIRAEPLDLGAAEEAADGVEIADVAEEEEPNDEEPED